MCEPCSPTAHPPSILLPTRPRRHQVRLDGATHQLYYRADGSLHRELSLIHRRLLRRVGEQTAILYCRDFLAFERYAHTVSVNWDAPPSILRQVARGYFRRSGAYIRERSDDWLIYPQPDDATTPCAERQNLRLVMESLRSVYRAADQLGLYPHAEDPFTKPFAAEISRPRSPQPPSWSGLTPPTARHQPDRYFVFRGGYWTPAHLLDPAGFYAQVTAAFTAPQVSLRDQLIVRILFEGGPRVREVCALSIQGWAAPLTGSTPFGASFKVANKGHGPAARKWVHVSPGTGELLREYFGTERRALDPLDDEFTAWCLHRSSEPTPEAYLLFLRSTGRSAAETAVFLNRLGRAYSANAFRKGAWRPRLAAAGLAARPHQARHWFVTTYLQAIEVMCQGQMEAYHQHRQALGAYMAWADPERMFQAYDQTLTEHRIQDRLVEVTTWLQHLHARGHFAAVLGAPSRVSAPSAGPLAQRLTRLNRGDDV